MRFGLLLFAAVMIVSTVQAQSSAPAGDLRYVLPNAPGSVTVALKDLQPQEMSLLDQGTRLVVQFGTKGSELLVSYVLQPGAASSEACRDKVMSAVTADLSGNGTLAGTETSTRKIANGTTLATTSFRITKAGVQALDQSNVFGFYSNAQTCFEIHVAKSHYVARDKPLLDAAVQSFAFDPTYVPKPADYGIVASLFFTYLQDFPSAAVYYERALETLPKADMTAPTATILGRMTAFQLGASLGMAGDLAKSRAVSEAAIGRDPDFPLFYYNLANAYAEADDAAQTEANLQKAFERRKNLPAGLSMPDPEADGAFQKLKQDPAFAEFLRTLPRA